MRATVGLFVLILAGVTALAGTSARAADLVREIVVEGVQRIEPETVRSYMSLREGDEFEAEKVDKTLKALFATGLFADVTLKREGNALLVRVVENPVINRVAFEGNRKVKDDQLQPEVQLRPRTVYTRSKVQNDVKRVLDVYRRSGRFAATVEPKIIQLEQNRVDLVFEINEGQVTEVRRINFVGNKTFGEGKLREQLRTKESRWYRIFSSDDTYDPDRVTFDRELLRRHYLKNGYADFRVVSSVAELSPSREEFFITYTLDEGERYKFGTVDVQAGLKDLNVDAVKARIKTEKGEWYNSDLVEQSVQGVTDAVGTLGYAFVDVRPRIERDRENKLINLVYDIQEGPRVFVERIDITGNVRTLDKVIRREFRLAEGDAFNTAKMRRSRQRIQDLGFFEKVEVTNVPSDEAPDRTVVKVDVQEKSTGEVSLGVGWSSTIGALFDVGVRERNLLGRGQDLRLNAQLAQRATQYDIGFTEPYFLDREVAAGFDLFWMTRNLQRESSYSQTVKGGDVRAGYRLAEHLTQDVRYTLKTVRVENVKSTASTLVQSQEGERTYSMVSQGLLYDRRDSRLAPTDGYYLRMRNDVAGAGGTEKFLRTDVDAGYYFPVAEQIVLMAVARAGYVAPFGKEVRIVDRYFLGSDSLRGFAASGVSARDKTTNDALGGNWMATGTIEMSFPIGLPNEYGISGKAFTDFGTIGAPSGNLSNVNDSRLIRSAVGTGISWKSPMGPVSIDFALPITKETYDKEEVFRINFGSRF